MREENEKFPKVRVTRMADDHIEKIVEQMKAQGLSVSKTGYLSALIMSQPIPTPAKRRASKPALTSAGTGAAV